MSAVEGLRSLGRQARTGRLIPPVSLDEMRELVRGLDLRPRPPRYGVVTDELKSAGWGLVVSDDAGPEVQKALEPLLRLRRRQAGGLYREFVVSAGEDASAWRHGLFTAHGRAEPREIPWYLLVVGGADAIPFGFEHDLKPSHAVGRLAFSSPDDLAAYAERALSAEQRAETLVPQPRLGVFAPTHRGDVITELSLEHFALPIQESALKHRDGQPRRLEVESALRDQATRSRLRAMIAKAPNLLLAVAHGLLYEVDDPAQRARQGGIVCADWPGPVEAERPIELAESFLAEDLPAGALHGGLAILLGCFTAGTPQFDLYDSPELAAANRLASSPFVSALAERLLGREGGALAVMGHVGRAFEAGFYWRGVRQSATFEDAVRALLDGHRLGVAFDGLGQRHADIAVAWTRQHLGEGTPPDPLDFWVAMNDARSWTLLGDPAVRLTL